MCLRATTGRILTMPKDRVVYKCLLSGNLSPYMDKRYLKDKLYNMQRGTKFEVLDGEVGAGFHAFSTYKGADYALYHSGMGADKIVKLTIPKGAKYVLGDNDEIVSDRVKTGDLANCVKPSKGY